jgi:hypothetical protein
MAVHKAVQARAGGSTERPLVFWVEIEDHDRHGEGEDAALVELTIKAQSDAVDDEQSVMLTRVRSAN